MHRREDGEIRSRMCSFFKDLRKINVGDCALFEPVQDSPPSIGIIRSLGSDKENLQLSVNWLYRPADIKLVKGVALEAAPNEVFYSFKSDEIPAASLLHPCKVAFLPKGVELPSGVSSFVCRRVYDTTNKCLWWLTDHSIVNDQRKEVDQLLRKTQSEMHATVQQQQGGRSPKPGSSPMSTSQLKQSPDSVQNSSTSFPSHQKGKKRERNDQVSEPAKRERTARADDADFSSVRSESMLKSEIAKITDKGGLVDSDGVERLVQLMHPDKSERRIDLARRSLLTGVIAATDKIDCLNRFVQLGLPVLDEWLQDVHRGKVGDSSSPRDHDRSVEDFLLVLLRALDRLPVNLNALQMCNIGKSVNHLRSHRNSEIQKKARSLVDTWKKRVEAEMNINDAKSASGQAVSWTARARHEVSHGGNRHTGGPMDTSTKNPVSQPSVKPASAKLVPSEAVGKTAVTSASAGNVKLPSSPASTGANMSDGHLRTSAVNNISEPPQSAARDDKSSGSSQSHTNSQCSSEHAKNPGLSGKEDTRSANSGSTSLNKSSGGASRQRKSANGLQGVAASGIQRDVGSSRNVARVHTAEKVSQSQATCERIPDTPVSDSNSHKLIVKISNRGRSPAQIANGGSTDDSSLINRRASSPAHMEKHGQSDRISKDKNDGCRNNTVPETNNESWQSNDLKDGVAGCDEGNGSPAPATAPDFGRCQTGEVSGKAADVTKAVSSSKSEIRPRKPHDSSLSSINALIESCAKFAEGNASVSTGDDGGMDLLASVAAGEMSTSNGGSPTQSPQGSAAAADETMRPSPHGDGAVSRPDNNPLNDAADVETQKQNAGAGALSAVDNDKGNHTDRLMTAEKDPPHDADVAQRPDVKSNEVSVSPACAAGGDGVGQDNESKAAVKEGGPVDKGTDISLKEKLPASAHVKHGMKDEPSTNVSAEQSLSESAVKTERTSFSSCVVNNLLPGQLNDLKADDIDVGCGRLVNHDANGVKIEDAGPAPHKQEESMLESTVVTDQKTKHHQEEIGKREAPAGSANKTSSPSPAAHEKEVCSDSKSSKLSAGEEMGQHASGAAADKSSPAHGSSGADGRFVFDLNEGFDVDDGCKDEDPSGAVENPVSRSSIPLSSPLPTLSMASTSVNVPSLITVAAAAKGPFVPPEDLLRSKGELGWKGSAATSAFRPAEPRKVSELPSTNNSKQGRVFLEFDLNVADESIPDDMAQNSDGKPDRGDQCGATSTHSAGGLDLDLNRIDEAPELAQLPSNTHRPEAQLQPPAKMTSSGGVSNSESSRRDFDLNNGPAADETTVDSSAFSLHGRPNVPPGQPSIGFRISTTEVGSLNSWYPAGSAFSAISMPTPFPDREQQQQQHQHQHQHQQPPFPMVGGTSGVPPRILAAPTGPIPFNPDIYRGSVLSSSPAVPFPGGPFQYPVFPFGSSFPLPPSSLPGGGSTAFVDLSSGGRLCIPAVPSQLVGTAPGAVPSQFPRPYVVSLSDVSNSVAVENARKWGRQGLDLNAGPGGGAELEGRDENLPMPPRPVAVSSMGGSHLALTEEQAARMYPMAGGGVFKRKEPEGGWDSDRLSGYKQPSWQ